MDLVVGAKRVVVMMEHSSKEGKPKLLRKCALPLTGKRVVSAVCTDLAWVDITPDGAVLRELAPGVTAEAVQKLTEARLIVGPGVKTMQV
jgi:3-oxoacid CoA-transferase subunit B